MHLIITNHRGHTWPRLPTLYCFHAKLELMLSTCQFMLSSVTTSFPSSFFNSYNIQGNVHDFSAHTGALMTRTDFILSTVLLHILQVRSYFRCRFSTPWQVALDSSLTVAWFPWTNHNSLLFRGSNQLSASFCIDDRLCQIACLLVWQSGQRPGFQVKLKNFEVSKLSAFCIVFLYFIK